MTRCIHCTRCVRFGQEIAGIMELGMIGRGEHAEIVSFVGKRVDSELSGNMIDLCPVGALTSKPFRYTARTWELSRRRSIAPHDGLGSNLIVQVKQNRVMRVLPLENEAVNECWLSDKDRFSYEGLNSARAAAAPDGQARRRSGKRSTGRRRSTSLVAHLQGRVRRAGVAASDARRALSSLASSAFPADFRLRQSDFSADGKRAGIPWLGMPIAELGELDRVLVVGSFLRKDHPLLAHRLRQAAKRGAQIHMLHSVDDDWLMPIASKKIVPPSELASTVAGLRRDSCRREERRGAARQLRPAASAGRADPCRGAGAWRQGRHSSARRRTPSAAISPDCPRAATCATCSSRRRSCCSTSSPSSTAPTRWPALGRCRTRSSW